MGRRHGCDPPLLLVDQILMATGCRTGAWATVAGLGIVFVAAGCGLNEFVTTCPPPLQGAGASFECGDPGGSDQEAVLFLLGDAGYVRFEQNPVLQDLQERVQALGDLGVPVMVLYLGDNVYDAGIRADNPQDLELLDAQVEVVRGDSARARFVPGNHDWANTTDPLGRRRLLAQERALRTNGIDLGALGSDTFPMVPEAGCPGPRRVDIRNREGALLVRVLALDSQWWIASLAANPDCASRSKQDVARRLRSELAAAGDTQVVLAAHHPLITGGPHGGNGGTRRGIGYSARLSSQDLAAAAYRDYLGVIEPLVASSQARIIFAAGHDHSLQVHEVSQGGDGGSVGANWYSLVSGSASKRTDVRAVERDGVQTLFAASIPGYMRLDFRSRGRIQLSVVAGCPDTEQAKASGLTDVAFEPPLICETDRGFRTIISKSIR